VAPLATGVPFRVEITEFVGAGSRRALLWTVDRRDHHDRQHEKESSAANDPSAGFYVSWSVLTPMSRRPKTCDLISSIGKT